MVKVLARTQNISGNPTPSKGHKHSFTDGNVVRKGFRGAIGKGLENGYGHCHFYVSGVWVHFIVFLTILLNFSTKKSYNIFKLD
jgi:hypothetical protein